MPEEKRDYNRIGEPTNVTPHVSDNPLVQKMLPLSESCAYTLASILRGADYGYAIIKKVEELSDGTVLLGVGNMYTALQLYAVRGLIKSSEDQPKGRRRIYEITEFGQEVLDAEQRRLQFWLNIYEKSKTRKSEDIPEQE